MDKLTDLFGGDQSRQDDLRDFERRHRENPDDISEEEAARRYREMMEHSQDSDEDEEMHGEYERAFSQMSPEERRSLAQRYQEADRDGGRSFEGYPKDQDLERSASPRELGRMTRHAARKDPDLLQQLTGPNSPLSGRIGKMAMSGLAAFAAKRFLGRR